MSEEFRLLYRCTCYSHKYIKTEGKVPVSWCFFIFSLSTNYNPNFGSRNIDLKIQKAFDALTGLREIIIGYLKKLRLFNLNYGKVLCLTVGWRRYAAGLSFGIFRNRFVVNLQKKRTNVLIATLSTDWTDILLLFRHILDQAIMMLISRFSSLLPVILIRVVIIFICKVDYKNQWWKYCGYNGWFRYSTCTFKLTLSARKSDILKVKLST